MAEKAKLIPFYILVDVSYSMTERGKITAANNILGELVQAFSIHPILSDKVRIGVIDFSDDARVVIPLDDPLDLESLPTLEARGGTAYGAAFIKLRTEIQRNVDELKASGFAVHRPAVYFVTDGAPTDVGWEREFAELTTYDKATKSGFPYYPNFIPCGVGDADPHVLAQLIHPRTKMKMFLQKEGGDPAKALASMIEIIIGSTLSSAQSVDHTDGDALQLPHEDDLPEDIEMVDGDAYL